VNGYLTSGIPQDLAQTSGILQWATSLSTKKTETRQSEGSEAGIILRFTGPSHRQNRRRRYITGSNFGSDAVSAVLPSSGRITSIRSYDLRVHASSEGDCAIVLTEHAVKRASMLHVSLRSGPNGRSAIVDKAEESPVTNAWGIQVADCICAIGEDACVNTLFAQIVEKLQQAQDLSPCPLQFASASPNIQRLA
jgi:hypothetical protein